MRVLLACVLLAGSVGAQTAWAVDLSGGGDFTQIAGAIASSAVGARDRLLVMPGSCTSCT